MYLLHASALAQDHQHANCPKVNLFMQMRGRTGGVRSEPELCKKAASWIVRLYYNGRQRRLQCFYVFGGGGKHFVCIIFSLLQFYLSQSVRFIYEIVF